MNSKKLSDLKEGCIVECRSHRHLVESVEFPSSEIGDTIVKLACLDDDANGQITEVFWEREVDARVIGDSTWGTVGNRGFDDPKVFLSYLNSLKWNCVTSTDPSLFQAPLRAGIDVKPYQLEPLRKALRMPRVNLFIADDVGLGKTIEAGLILRELLLRQKVQRIVVIPPPSVVLQWKGEMEARFGLDFKVMDRKYISNMRRERGWGINPWSTHTRFILSQSLVRNEEYASSLRDWLGEGAKTILILDEAHNAAPASSSKYAIDSKLTRVIRDLAWRFEHKLFLSATPHNGHSNSFSALLEILDPTRFCRGVPVRNKTDLEPILVRRLKEDLRRIGVDLPKRIVVPIIFDGLGKDIPELQLSILLKRYKEKREYKLKNASFREKAAELLVIGNLQKRLLSSIEAFHRTLNVHINTIKKKELGEELKIVSNPDQLKLLKGGIDGDDDRASIDEIEVEEEAADQHQIALATTGHGAGEEEWRILNEMNQISSSARYQNDERINYLKNWIKKHMCFELGEKGAKWNNERLLIFTEYADTKRWLYNQISSLIADSDLEEHRIETFHGGIGDDKRESLKSSFNSNPDENPLRILIATDAAREGVNLQNYCKYLFHFDIPWNPSRMEQRNGRIDRTLQKADKVFCYYFVLAEREEDRVLDVLVKKTEEIRNSLGTLPPVIVGRLNELLQKGINPSKIGETISQIEGVEEEEAIKRSQELIKVELEDNSREREDALKQQISTLEKALIKSEKWLNFSSDLFRDALNTSLKVNVSDSKSSPQILLKDPSLEHQNIEKAEWIFPSSNELPGGEQSWGDVLDFLRPPRKPGQKIWEWRKETRPQSVVFKDPDKLDSGTVHLHLEHPLVKRLLSRFLVRGFQTNNLNKAAVLATHDNKAKLILLARLSLYGYGATRLHDEMIELVAEWDPMDSHRKLRVLNSTKAGFAIEDLTNSLKDNLPEVDLKVQNKLREFIEYDVKNLEDKLNQVVNERAYKAMRMLEGRADAESRNFIKLLNEQRERVLKTQRKHDTEYDQLSFGFADQELIQLRLNRNHWDNRLDKLEKDIKIEPEKIKKTFEVATSPRIEPAGVIFLWPVDAELKN